MSKPHSLCRDSQFSVKMGFTFKGSASASSLCTCAYIIPTFWTSPKEWVSTYLTSAWPKSQLCLPEKWENLPEGKENPGNTLECRNACLSPNFGFIFILSVTLGTWDWTLPFDSPYHFSHPRKPDLGNQSQSFKMWMYHVWKKLQPAV